MDKKSKRQKSCYTGKKFFLILLFIGIVPVLNAQTQAPSKLKNDLKIETDGLNKKVDIAFGTEKEIYNLLVIVTDSLGQTVFLDNKYKFKGDYKHSIDFKEYKKGSYSVKIIADDEKVMKKIDVR
jgi:hypothetical protein